MSRGHDAPTPAQRRALEAVRDGTVTRWYPHWGGPRWPTIPCNPRSLDKVIESGWAEVQPRPLNAAGLQAAFAPVTLTDEGRRVIG